MSKHASESAVENSRDWKIEERVIEKGERSTTEQDLDRDGV